MTGKIFRSTFFLAAVVLLCTVGIILGMLYGYFDNVQQTQLKNELELASAGVQQKGLDYLKAVSSQEFRLTWVDANGKVLYDTVADESAMQSHADREEIREAFENGTGSSARYSDTLTEKNLYEAKLLEDGTVLRISVNSATTAAVLLGLLAPICGLIVAVILLSVLISHRMSRRIVEPLNRLDLEHPLNNDVYEEISPLLQRINQQHLQISAQMRTLQQKNDEFDQITENMKDGLVLLDRNGLILSINPAARALFSADESCVGKDFLAVDSSNEMRNAVNSAYLEGTAHFDGNRRGRDYRFAISRITSGGSTAGAVVLAFDVTEQIDAERTRREFSANVSHELKTPLQTIMGSAELMENGLVKQEDVPRFVGHIRMEAARLLSLIEDIIRLSQLDEGGEFPREDVDLLALANEVCGTLQPAAEQKQVTIRTTGETCVINGVRRLLYEIVYNLTENAVKYNVEKGSVQIAISKTDKNVVLQVKDTGIGIPEEHLGRIFQRFYRVDKSHSKASGGTGLGLSIVRHAAVYHKAELQVDSVLGMGTAVTVVFPQ